MQLAIIKKVFLKAAVRSLFIVTSRNRALCQAKRFLNDYLELADRLSREVGKHSVKVPPMRGVDEDMRDWSFYMILEHNTIVNRSISATIQQLVHGETLPYSVNILWKKKLDSVKTEITMMVVT